MAYAITTKGRANLMNTESLADQVRRLRLSEDMTQAELAERMVQAGYADRLSTVAISKAERADTGPKMNQLRVAIIEELTGERLAGPFWLFESELEAPDSAGGSAVVPEAGG